MLHTKIEAADPALIDQAARRCGELAIGCAATGGEVQAVIGSVRRQLRTLTELQAVMASLEGDQRQVADATDEARLLAHSAKTRLLEGNETVDTAAATFAKLTDLVAGLGTRITSFAGALEQVRRTTDLIDRIARTTNMLALNAAIEAERAGEGGAAFAVVATEVKNLARSTRNATDEVARTMTSLTLEAETFMDEVREGMAHGEAARVGLETITSTLNAVTGIVEQVDRQSEDIAHSAGTIHASVCRVGDELDNFAAAALDDDVRLVSATEKMSTLERDANAMFDTIVRSGFAHEDGEMVAIAVAQRDEFLEAALSALNTGKVSKAALFDRNYRPIPGSNPERYDTRSNAFADEVWRPLLDRVITLHPNIVSTACTDVNGYLPTHTTKYSEEPTGDPVHDAAFCRHRRILADDSDKVAKASDKPYHLSVFRRDRKGGGHDVVRNVYVPLIIDGERWGDFEIAYRLS